MNIRALVPSLAIGSLITIAPAVGQSAPSATPSPPAPPSPPVSRTSAVPRPPAAQAPAAGFAQRTAAGPTNRLPSYAWPLAATNAGLRPAATPAAQPASTPLAPFPLVFDAESKTQNAKAEDTNMTFIFKFTNTSPAEVTIDRVQTSCGCTTTKLPVMPWKLAPGTNGEFEVVANVRGRRGLFSKMVYVYTSQGFKALNIKVNLPEASVAAGAERMRNLQLAVTDRQAVLKGDCARCHVEPGVGKQGRELYLAVCAVCHEAERRANVVPNLHALQHPTDASHWYNWITHGKDGTLMPAFSPTEGGPLSEEQIASLVQYLVKAIPSRPVAAPAAPSALPTQ